MITTYNEISQAMGQAIEAVLLGKAQPQQALDQAAYQVNPILARAAVILRALGSEHAAGWLFVAAGLVPDLPLRRSCRSAGRCCCRSRTTTS